MVGVAPGELLGDREGLGGTRPRRGQKPWREPWVSRRALGVDQERFRVRRGEPGRRRRGGGGQAGLDAVGGEEVEDPVEPGELVAAASGSSRAQEKMPTLTRLTPASRMSAHVLGPRLPGPLLGVVVTAVEQPRDAGEQGAASLGQRRSR